MPQLGCAHTQEIDRLAGRSEGVGDRGAARVLGRGVGLAGIASLYVDHLYTEYPPDRVARGVADYYGALSGPLAAGSFVASLVALNALSDVRYPMPGADPAAIRRYFSQEHGAARIGAAAQLVCAASLARFGKSAAALAARARPGSRWLQAASVAGGAVSAASLAASALLTLTLTTGRGERNSDAETLYRLMFVSGGPIHGVGLALLVGSLGLSGLRTGALPARLSKAALASSVAGGLSPLALVGKVGLAFIPLGRLSALAVSGIAGVRLARGVD